MSPISSASMQKVAAFPSAVSARSGERRSSSAISSRCRFSNCAMPMNRGSLISWKAAANLLRNDAQGVTIMAMKPGDIEDMIKAGIPGAKVTIRDLAGDGDHYAAEVVAEAFRGKSRVQQHQMVYEALKGNMGGILHALALQTSAPE